MFKWKKELKRLLLLFPVCILLVSISISVVLYQGFVKYYISSVQSEYVNTLIQAQKFTDNLFFTIKNEVQSYSEDPNITKLLYGNDLDNLDQYKILYKIDRYVDYNFSDKVLCIYNRSMNTIFYKMKTYNFDNFFDKDLAEKLNSPDGIDYLSPIPRISGDYTHPNNKGTEEVYTFFYSTSKGAEIENAVIVNIPVKHITDNVMNIYHGNKSELIIIDAEGNVVLGSNTHPFLSKIDSNLYKKVSETKKEAGYFIGMNNNEKSLVTYASSKISGWTFLRFTSYSMIEEGVSNIVYKTIYTVFGFTILFLLATLLISKSTYKSHLFKIQTLETNYKRNNGYSETQKLLRALLTEKNDEVIWKKLLLLVNPISMEENFQLLLFKINDYPGYCNKYSMSDRELFEFGIINIIQEIYNCNEYKALACSNDDHFTLLLHDNNLKEISDDSLKLKAKKVQYEIDRFIKVSFSVIIGDFLTDGFDINEEYKTCKNYMNYQIFFGNSMVQTTEDISNSQNKEYDIPENMFKTLVGYLGEGDKERAQAIIHELIERVESYNYSSLKLFLIKLATAIQENSCHDKLSYDNAQVEHWLALIQKLQDMTSLQELEQEIMNLSEDLIDRVSTNDSIHNKRITKLLTKVDQIIHDNYSDSNFNADHVANMLMMSPSYLKKLFKSEMEISLNEYITSYRLEKVVQLLRETETPIVDIAEHCGFHNVNYFYTIFKKKYGVTANTYRQIVN